MSKITACISVDWEGENLSGIESLQKFNGRFPGIPLTHFISGAYLARAPGSDEKKAIVDAMVPGIKSTDEIALHIHCWKSLVPYDQGKEYTTDPFPPAMDCEYAGQQYTDTGYVIELTSESFGRVLVNAFFDVSIKALQPLLEAVPSTGGARSIKGFRSGAWLVNDTVFDVMQDGKGLVYDASAVDCQFTERTTSAYRQALEPMIEAIASFWGSSRGPHNTTNCNATMHCGVRRMTGPYRISRTLLELPNNGMLIPAVDVANVRDFFAWALLQPGDQEVYVSVGFHQENSSNYIDEFMDAIDLYAQNPRIRWLTHAGYADVLQ